MCAGKVSDGQQRGRIVPIGGAEEEDNSPAILKRFVELAGGSDADIVVIPPALHTTSVPSTTYHLRSMARSPTTR